MSDPWAQFKDAPPAQGADPWAAFKDAAPVKPAAPQGLWENVKDQAGKAAQAADDVVRLAANGLTFGLADNVAGALTPGSSVAAEHAKSKEAMDRAGTAGLAAELGGGLVTGLGAAKNGLTLIKEAQPLWKRALAMGAEGAGYGAVSGAAGGDDLDSRIRGAITGVALGGGIGGALPVAGKAAGAVVSGPLAMGLSRINPQGFAQTKLETALGRSGKTADEVARAVADADAAGQGVYTVADALGKPGQNALSTVTRSPGPGQTAAAKFLEERQAGQAGRVGDIIDQGLGADATARRTSQQLMARAKADSAPLYEKAYEGGSLAPLETQFQNAFGDAAERVSQAQKSLADARQQELLAKAKVSNAGENVYSNAVALPAERQAGGAIAAAEKGVASAEADKAAILERLRQAQADGSANAPGAVWTPRIQQFLDDPITKAGLNHGLEVQRLEALAAGKKFDPTEFAIVGTNEAGEPIVGKVPNMRTLDAIKGGLDDMLEAYRDKTTGLLRLDDKGRAIDAVRREFLKHIDEINPTYGQARAAYAGPASINDAVTLGKSAATRGRAADTLDTFNRQTDPQKQGFRTGYADTLNAGIERGRVGQNAAGKFTAEKYQTELPALSLHQGPQQPGATDEMLKRIGRENDMFATRNRALGGSQTFDNFANEGDIGVIPKLFLSASSHNPLHMIGGVVRVGKDAWTGNTEAVRKELGDLLMRRGSSPDLAELLGTMQARTERGNRIGAAAARGLTIGEGMTSGAAATPDQKRRK